MYTVQLPYKTHNINMCCIDMFITYVLLCVHLRKVCTLYILCTRDVNDAEQRL